MSLSPKDTCLSVIYPHLTLVLKEIIKTDYFRVEIYINRGHSYTKHTKILTKYPQTYFLSDPLP